MPTIVSPASATSVIRAAHPEALAKPDMADTSGEARIKRRTAMRERRSETQENRVGRALKPAVKTGENAAVKAAGHADAAEKIKKRAEARENGGRIKDKSERTQGSPDRPDHSRRKPEIDK